MSVGASNFNEFIADVTCLYCKTHTTFLVDDVFMLLFIVVIEFDSLLFSPLSLQQIIILLILLIYYYLLQHLLLLLLFIIIYYHHTILRTTCLLLGISSPHPRSARSMLFRANALRSQAHECPSSHNGVYNNFAELAVCS